MNPHNGNCPWLATNAVTMRLPEEKLPRASQSLLPHPPPAQSRHRHGKMVFVLCLKGFPQHTTPTSLIACKSRFY
jgi:hypothetical protein